MKTIRKLDNLLSRLAERIFQPLDISVPLTFRAASHDERAAVLTEDRAGWLPVTRDHIWGEPDGYYWFGGTAQPAEDVAGQRIVGRIEAAFGNVMGRSDPQCLVRINGTIAQGGDANHREFLLTPAASLGQSFDILIEAGTIEDRRQLGFGVTLHRHDLDIEETYYDLRVPLDVARLLAEDDARRHFILRTLNEAIDAIDFRPGNEERFKASLAKAQAIAAAIYQAVDFEDKPVVVATGHTHIDVAWLWRVRETRQKMARSMATALALMEEFPDYRFMYNQCVLLDYLDKDYPELFDRIRAHVTTGRFEIEGALWLEPDVNIAGGEALVRHILYGVRYHRETFGVDPRMVWLPDTFGYSAALPQLMAKSGLDSFVTHKLSWNDTNRMPEDKLFWQGIDGSQVVAYFLTTQPYDSKLINTTYCPNLKPTHVMGTWKRHGQQHLGKELFLVYGHGDGGGGPTREMLQNIRRMERGIPGCPKVEHGPMRPFFERLITEMQAHPDRYPVWVGELYLEFHRGTLTSVAKNKRFNRQAEIALRELETLAVMAERHADHAYPAERLRALWDIVMLNQFHDILPGSSIGAVFDDSDRDYARLFEEAAALKGEFLSTLNPAGRYAVLNITGRQRSGLALAPPSLPSSQTIVMADGSEAGAVYLTDVPPLSLIPVDIATKRQDGAQLIVEPLRLANDLIDVTFDANGRIASLTDRKTGHSIFKPGQPANRLQAFRDMPAEYDAWDIDSDFEDQSFEIDNLVSAEIVETGPLRAALRFEWRYESSRIVQVVSLEAGARQLEFDTFIDWHEHHTLLKTGFPMAVNAASVDAEIQFGHVRRATHRNTSWDKARFECSMQRWIDIGEPGFGIAFLNDCKYGYDAKDNDIRLTLLRSPTYPWPDADQGQHQLRYAVMVHDGDKAAVHEAAEDINMPLQILAVDQRNAQEAAGRTAPLLSVDTAGITLEAVKRAEAGDGYIVRLWETTGQRREASVRLGGQFASAMLVDLLEEKPEPIRIVDDQLNLVFKPFEILTLKLTD
ncbi:alpha-mannosidase [Allorhizobium taibaishanense]|uniref:Alpha-mannosidase n=1 Tax=Allorhizobium taibaishanense TaxID=887144 RepID=A0A1Q9A6P4_9HYPH|nr:glycoside hydrolase family 38 C-terminal domain-containing protein [Allorhizobium taibaishanense]MBB4008612.1 alpha-mannosidase [Allorhizobium taibaishanense]OLP50249.1 alpha-mannosidase [Allorhizobium taibaishanense]